MSLEILLLVNRRLMQVMGYCNNNRLLVKQQLLVYNKIIKINKNNNNRIINKLIEKINQYKKNWEIFKINQICCIITSVQLKSIHMKIDHLLTKQMNK